MSPLGDVLVAAVARAPDTVSLAFPDRRVTTAELLERSREAARGLYALGTRRGDRVGILMPNCVEFVEVLFGAALLGAVALLINARYRRNELAHVVSDAGLRTIVTTDLTADRVDFVTLLEGALAGTDATGIVLGQSSPDGFIDGQAFGELASDVSEDIIDATAAAVSVAQRRDHDVYVRHDRPTQGLPALARGGSSDLGRDRRPLRRREPTTSGGARCRCFT